MILLYKGLKAVFNHCIIIIIAMDLISQPVARKDLAINDFSYDLITRKYFNIFSVILTEFGN